MPQNLYIFKVYINKKKATTQNREAAMMLLENKVQSSSNKDYTASILVPVECDVPDDGFSHFFEYIHGSVLSMRAVSPAEFV